MDSCGRFERLGTRRSTEKRRLVAMNTRGLEAAQEAVRRMRELGEVPERLDPLEKARRRPTSLGVGVSAKCFDCVGAENADNGARRAVRECPATRCPLHAVRPWK